MESKKKRGDNLYEKWMEMDSKSNELEANLHTSLEDYNKQRKEREKVQAKKEASVKKQQDLEQDNVDLSKLLIITQECSKKIDGA